MPSGGHARSGPQPDPNSLRSAARGLTLTALPAAGYDGETPDFPLPEPVVIVEYFEDGQKFSNPDSAASRQRLERELELWAWAWRTPQAAAWARETWRWPIVAMWVRTMALCESLTATAADKNALHRFADQIGLTPAGLKENGWRIAPDEVAEKRSEKPADKSPTARDRMRALRGAASA